MLKERYDQLSFGPDPQRLTSEEYTEGWHWCWEWDALLVGPDMPEWGGGEKCLCGRETGLILKEDGK